MQVGDIIRVKVFGEIFGQSVLNVFFYRVESLIGINGLNGNVRDSWVTGFQTNILNYLTDSISYNRFLVENLTDGLEFFDSGIVAAGAVASPALPSSIALGFRLNRSTKLTRHGWKRFPGIAELAVTGNVQEYPAIQTDAMAAWLGNPLLLDTDPDPDNETTWQPVIVGRTKNVEGVYEIDLAKINDVAGASVRTNVSTQNTRKP